MDLRRRPIVAASLTAVIPAHNAATTLDKALASLDGVADVVVVDDGSTDESSSIARAHGARVVRHETPLGPAAARNAGIRSTAGELVLLLDADAEPEDGWLGPLLSGLSDPLVSGVAPRIRAPADSTPLGRYEAAAGPLDLGTERGTVHPGGAVPFVPTTALLLRRSAWESVGGFSEDLRFGEDLDLGWRLAAEGKPLLYEPASTVWHGHRDDLGSHLRNRYRYGTAAGPLFRRHKHHPRAAVAPPLLSAGFVLGIIGLRRTGLAIGAASVIVQARQSARGSGSTSLRRGMRAVSEHIEACRGLAAAVSRPWLPLALVTAAVFPRARAPLAGVVVARSMIVRRRSGADLPVGRWMWLRALDDLAQSAGVISGCLRARTMGPLLPAAPEPAQEDAGSA